MKALFLLTTVAILVAVVYLVLRSRRIVVALRARRDDRRRSPEPRLPPARLETLVRELLQRRGWRMGAPEEGGVAIARGPGEARMVVQVEPTPPRERVPADHVRDLAERVQAHHADIGLLVTPYHIDRAAAPDGPVTLELMDGRALLAAVERELPQHLDELRRFRLTGTERAPSLSDRSRDEALAS